MIHALDGAPGRARRNSIPASRIRGSRITALATLLMLLVALTLAGCGSTAGVPATGKTTTVKVTAKDMRFTPASVNVPAGNRLVIELKNTDASMVHDLKLEGGPESGRLYPGESATVDAGVVGADINGWCSVQGHREKGMVFAVHAVSGSAAPAK